jgi:hypothetical protein
MGREPKLVVRLNQPVRGGAGLASKDGRGYETAIGQRNYIRPTGHSFGVELEEEIAGFPAGAEAA